MRTNKLETARRLASAHSKAEPNLKHVHLLEPVNEQDPEDPIKLLEVVEGTIERGIEPIAFMPDPTHDIYYPSLIVEVSPREYIEIRKGMLGFQPHAWTIDPVDLLAHH